VSRQSKSKKKSEKGKKLGAVRVNPVITHTAPYIILIVVEHIGSANA